MIQRIGFSAVLALLVTGLASKQTLAEGCTKPPGCHQCGECGSSLLVCRPVVEMKKVKKHCWEVECDYVCIPKVHFPLFSWFKKGHGSCLDGLCDDSCGTAACGVAGCTGQCGTSGCQGCETCPKGPLCARVRQVHRLKKVEYECEECVVTWKLERGCIAGCSSGSAKLNCDGSVSVGCGPAGGTTVPPAQPAY